MDLDTILIIVITIAFTFGGWLLGVNFKPIKKKEIKSPKVKKTEYLKLKKKKEQEIRRKQDERKDASNNDLAAELDAKLNKLRRNKSN